MRHETRSRLYNLINAEMQNISRNAHEDTEDVLHALDYCATLSTSGALCDNILNLDVKARKKHIEQLHKDCQYHRNVLFKHKDIINVVLGFDCCYYEIDENDPDFYEKGELMEMIDSLSNIMDKCIDILKSN